MAKLFTSLGEVTCEQPGCLLHECWHHPFRKCVPQFDWHHFQRLRRIERITHGSAICTNGFEFFSFTGAKFVCGAWSWPLRWPLWSMNGPMFFSPIHEKWSAVSTQRAYLVTCILCPVILYHEMTFKRKYSGFQTEKSLLCRQLITDHVWLSGAPFGGRIYCWQTLIIKKL